MSILPFIDTHVQAWVFVKILESCKFEILQNLKPSGNIDFVKTRDPLTIQ